MIDKNEWTEWLKLKGLSEKTIRDYNLYFDKLEIDKLNHRHLLKFLQRYNNGVSRAMIKNLLYYIKTGEFSEKAKIFARDFDIPKLTGRKKKTIPRILTKQEVHKIAMGMARKREKYMVLTTYYLGLRSAELLDLNIDSFDWERKTVKVLGKGKKERILPVIPQLLHNLAKYVNECIDKDGDFYLLFDLSGRRWRKILEVTSKKSLGYSVNPHVLRHSVATYLLDSGLNIKEVAEFLGHSSVNTTQIYLHLNKDKLHKRLRGALE